MIDPPQPARTSGHDDGPEVVGGPAGVERAVAVLRSGGLVAFPTETVYGLGADARRVDAVRRIFAAKGRPPSHPLIVHLGSAEEMTDWAETIPQEAWRLAAAHWPGPLTLLLRRHRSVPEEVTGGRDTVGLRVPSHPVALAMLRAFGSGVAAPSANRFGRVSPTSAEHVVADLGSAVDLVLDGGRCEVGVESTIVDLTGAEPTILRPGGLTIEELTESLGRPPCRSEVTAEVGESPAPGTLASHYSPGARVVLVEPGTIEGSVEDAVLAAEEAGARRIGVLTPTAIDRRLASRPSVIELEPAGENDRYAEVLYERLHQADRLGIEVLICALPDARGRGDAVIDRLRRAAASD